MVEGIDVDGKSLAFVNVVLKEKAIVSFVCHFILKRANHLLELVHSDACDRIGTRSLGGGEYFVATRALHFLNCFVFKYIPICAVCHHQQMLRNQLEGRLRPYVVMMKVNTPLVNLLRILPKKELKRELTTPHTPQLNGTADRLNQTLKRVHTMLADSRVASQVLGRGTINMC